MEVFAFGMHDGAQTPGLHPLLPLRHEVPVDAVLCHHVGAPGAADRIDNARAIGQRGRGGDLAQHVAARVQRRHRLVGMKRDGGAEEDDLRAGSEELLVAHEALAVRQLQLALETRQRLFGGVATRHDLAPRFLRKEASIPGAPADAHQPDSPLTHPFAPHTRQACLAGFSRCATSPDPSDQQSESSPPETTAPASLTPLAYHPRSRLG